MRVAISSSRPLALTGIRAALEADGELEIVGEARTVDETLLLVERTGPDAALVCTDLDDVVGLLDRVLAARPDLKVVLFADRRDAREAETALAHGASGYLLGAIEPSDLAAALRLCVREAIYAARDLPTLSASHQTGGLSDRERAVLNLLGTGLSNREIGRELWITEQTVKYHLANLYRKIGVGNRVEAVRWAAERRLL